MGEDSDSTVISITPKTPHGLYSRHSHERIETEGDAIEFAEFTQSQPLKGSSPDSDVPPNNRSASDNRQDTGFISYMGSDTSRPGFQFRALIDWKWETASCFLAVGSLLAIMATLYPYNGHPLPQWPYGLSINSLISIYTVIFKAAIYSILAQGLGQLKWTWFEKPRRLDHLESFDSASRGALGAAELLWVLGGRNLVATIGALVTIFAIAIDPFTQQLMHYYTCSQVVRASEATIPKTNLYNDPGGRHSGAMEKTINPSMQAAVYGGIFSPGTNRVTPNCPTGNCTFPELYKTIAYCAACSDITSQLKVTTYNDSMNFTVTNYTLPSGLQLSDHYGASFVIGAEADSITIQAIMGTSPVWLTCSPEWPWGCTGIGAAQCQLSMCIRTFNGSVKAGYFTETEIAGEKDTWFQNFNESIWGSSLDSSYLSTVDLTCLNNTERDTLKAAGYQFNKKTQWLAYNTSLPAGLSVVAANASGIALPANYTELDINGSCIYQTTVDAVTGMNEFLLTAFNGQASFGPQGDPDASSGFISVIFNGGNISAQTFATTFQNVTDSMTTNMRTYVDAHTPNYVAGIVLESDTCVDAQWGWLVFPAALLLLTLVFFTAVVVQARTRDAMVSGSQDYKNSALPLLFHGLEESTAARFGQGRHGMAKMSQDANELCVVLKPTDVGWRFVESDKL
ncbi:conserved hypothetical protein [Talaromyces stipitatus ATCC 10500]|uniref:Uncharacterized protein n=1 Tax=Talaromyces stipitatus (strain ATCC 10500 / CBS 375.48 / QM 6759 / NRRL 1006) TaxID=441959 RepID=B8M8J3_TALSN|nr:uncharacterized protein TSTA_037270 [Talaromyces stipitatus ATCC 10500]EED20506.1 conserved hypothetical protein [Talaromyces stipitatus ATCC 10500]